MFRRIISCTLFLALFGGLVGCSSKQEKALRQTAVISFVIGTVEFKGAHGSDWHPARAGFRLESGDVIRTGPDSRAEVQTRGPYSTIRLGENTSFVLQQVDEPDRKSLHARLLDGNFWGRIKDLQANETFACEMPMAVATVRGTTLRVEAAGDTAVNIYAYEGVVEVKTQVDESGGKKLATYNLGRGQTLRLSTNLPPQVASIPAGDGWRNGWQPKKRKEIEEEELQQPVSMRIEEKPRTRQVPTVASKIQMMEKEILGVAPGVFEKIRLKIEQARYLSEEDLNTLTSASVQEVEIAVVARAWDALPAAKKESLLNQTFYTLKTKYPDITRFVTLKFSDRRQDLRLEYARYAQFVKEPGKM